MELSPLVDPQDCGVLYGTLHIQVERDQVQNENVRMHERLLRSEKVRISFMQCIVNMHYCIACQQ